MVLYRRKKQTTKSIFRKILFPLMILVIIEILILVGSVFGQGIIDELNDNEKAIVDEKVVRRKNYLENEMISNWMNIEYTAQLINDYAQELIHSGKISVDGLDDSSESAAPLLSKSAGDLIALMRTNRVTGAFIILNTGDLSESIKSGQYENKPGIYLRDSDPLAQPSYRNQDLLIERAPIALVQQLGIATDTTWNPRFEFQETTQPYYDFLYKPFQTAYENPDYTMADCGYWSRAFQLFGEGKKAIAYSIPLKLSDGTVYGVLGVDITLEYLQEFMPSEEIVDNGTGAYFVALQGEDGKLSDVLSSGDTSAVTAVELGKIDTSQYYIHTEMLDLYNNNAPFSDEKWVLVGAVPMSSISEFTEKVKTALNMAVAATLLIGLAGSLLISYMFQKPISALSKEVRTSDPRDQIKLMNTGIEEIDQMTDAIEKLSRDVIESGKKFTQIIEMASVRLAGFQIDKQENKLFATEHFFNIFGHPELNERVMTPSEFNGHMDEMARYYVERDEMTDSYIYKVPDGRDNRFLRLKYREEEKKCYGLIEDVTQSLLEKRVLKHERDHDPLTNLYNRRAFRREVQKLFGQGKEVIKKAALIMVDLDNLKYINDTYGHDYGDKYIIKAAMAFQYFLPAKALAARISGDEFNIFLYGYEKEAEVRALIKAVKAGLDSMILLLPGDIEQRVQASGGVAWYPKDSDSFDTLMKYADFAMYTVKKSIKGEIGDFDKVQYQAKNSMFKNRAALTKLIERKAVQYAFQPIVDAHTGKIYAYEALMRPAMQEFKSVMDVLETAKYEGKLNQIEELTWFEAMHSFIKHIEAGRIDPDSKVFINSIPNQYITGQIEKDFYNEFGNYIDQIVLELTEEERVDKNVWEEKKSMHKMMGGKIALDDYGTGYNSEKMLLNVSPDFIKVDIEIVKDIQNSADKQTIVEYIVNYAHGRGKYIIAEGVETAEETKAVIRLGVDYLQGYFVAKPSVIPEKVSEQAERTIEEMNSLIAGTKFLSP